MSADSATAAHNAADRCPATLAEAGRELLFTAARTPRAFLSREVTDRTLAELWELARWPPTSSNCQPMRVVHVRSPAAKARLLPLVDERNQSKVRSAPVTSILATDSTFHRDLPQLYPPAPELRDVFDRAGPDVRLKQARFNGSLQAGYFVLAARAVGLAAGPMIGFDPRAVTAEFLDPGTVEALLLVNLGYPDPGSIRPRLSRLPAERVVHIV